MNSLERTALFDSIYDIPKAGIFFIHVIFLSPFIPKIDARVASWSNNQWKKNAFLLKFNGACTSALKFSRSLANFVFGAQATGCPIAKVWPSW